MPQPYVINSQWDQKANVWIATSPDVPGLCAQATRFEKLAEVVKALLPELLEANRARSGRKGHIHLDIQARQRGLV